MKRLLIGALALTVTSVGSVQAEEVLNAVHAFPKPLDFTKSFLRYVDEVNAVGAGVVRINVQGGPEVIPPPEQGDAVRRGVVDMHYGPATYYLGAFPEADAMVGSNLSPAETRANGGLDMLGQAFAEKMNAHLLGHFDTGIPFHLYLVSEPKRTEAGGIDLSGLKLRSQPIYREFFEKMGVSTVSIPVPEVYTALERGTVDGLGFPLVGVMDLGWHEHFRYRIDPPFFQTDLVTIVNLERWNALSDEAKAILQETAIAFEPSSHDYFQTYQAELDQKMRDAGIEVIDLEGEVGEAFAASGYETAWERFASKDAAAAAAFKEKFYRE
ncbi:MAG: TRAP transporter substrate-binding protein DctP [Alphaproteobacteria bacterium]